MICVGFERGVMPVLKKKKIFENKPLFMGAVRSCASRGIKSCRAKRATPREGSRMRRAAGME